jgi:hypothetical protein
MAPASSIEHRAEHALKRWEASAMAPCSLIKKVIICSGSQTNPWTSVPSLGFRG